MYFRYDLDKSGTLNDADELQYLTINLIQALDIRLSLSAIYIAGKQQGFSDEKGRGTIFFYVLDYITQKFPKLFILENVKGLTTLEKGKYHKQIMKLCTM